jgi:hypothetical protein
MRTARFIEQKTDKTPPWLLKRAAHWIDKF